MPAAHPLGELLKTWRSRRRCSQLQLALDAKVSPRHLSFIETGRSQPSKELLLHLAETLEVPLRERNRLLLAAGYAPSYRETPLDDDAMAPVRAALHTILSGHEPFPAVVVDLHWNLVLANGTARRLLSLLVDPSLLTGTPNVLRASLHPSGLARFLGNLAEYSAHVLGRLQRQLHATGDPKTKALFDELRAYPNLAAPHTLAEPAAQLFIPMTLRPPHGPPLAFFSTVATFGTALDVTMAELAIESFFAADAQTAEAVRAFAATAPEPPAPR